MQKPTKKLDQKVNQITCTYKQLQKTQFYIVKKTLIGSLRQLCLQGLEILDCEKITTENIRKKKQIQDMLKKCNQIQTKIDIGEKTNPSIGSGRGSMSKSSRMAITNNNQSNQQHQQHNQQSDIHVHIQSMTQNMLQTKTRQVAKSIIFHQLSSQHMKVTTQQLDQLAQRIQTNNQVMKQIQLMVYQQGGNIDKIEQQIKETYNMVEDANKELKQAGEIQHKTRMLKIRLGVSGFLGAFGLKILGLPGLIFGFFSGMIVTR